MKQAFLSILLMFLPLMASSETVEIDGIWYNIVSKAEGAEVIKNPNGYYSGDIVIPPSVIHDGQTYSVTSIGESAFWYCQGLSSVTIPNSVTSIREGAFRYCGGLTSITIPNSVTSIGERAFRDCSGLTSLAVPKGGTSIGE